MSSFLQTELERVFAESCSEAWCIETLKALEKAYIAAREHCHPPRFGPSESHDLRSHYCRAVFETEWRRLSNQHSGIKAESRPNKVGNYSHTWVQAGKLYLTASAVNSPRDKPRRAEFRNVYSANGQLSLFEQNEPTDENVYAILLYGPPQAVIPSFATVAFPSRHWRKYVQLIDLLAKYPGVISTPVLETELIQVQEPTIQPIQVSPEEKIQEPQKPRIRTPRRKAGEEGL